MSERRRLVDPSHRLSTRRQCQLLGVGESKENLALMAAMDRLFTNDPTLGVIGMQDELAELGMRYNIKRIRRLLRKMGVNYITMQHKF